MRACATRTEWSGDLSAMQPQRGSEQRASGGRASANTVEVGHAPARSPRDTESRMVGIPGRVGLVLDARLVQVVAADLQWRAVSCLAKRVVGAVQHTHARARCVAPSHRARPQQRHACARLQPHTPCSARTPHTYRAGVGADGPAPRRDRRPLLDLETLLLGRPARPSAVARGHRRRNLRHGSPPSPPRPTNFTPPACAPPLPGSAPLARPSPRPQTPRARGVGAPPDQTQSARTNARARAKKKGFGAEALLGFHKKANRRQSGINLGGAARRPRRPHLFVRSAAPQTRGHFIFVRFGCFRGAREAGGASEIHAI